MMKKTKLFNIGYGLLILISTYLMLMGILYIFRGTFMAYHVEFTSLTEADVVAYSAELMTLISVFLRLLGVGNFCGGFLILIIIIFALNKGEKWAWIAVLVSSGTLLLVYLIFTYQVYGLGGMYLTFIASLILDIVGLALTAKPVFSVE